MNVYQSLGEKQLHQFLLVSYHASSIVTQLCTGKKAISCTWDKVEGTCTRYLPESGCVQLKSFTGDVTAGEVRDNNDGSYMASFVAEQVGEAKLSVAINGEQIKGSPYSIVVGRNYQAIDKPSKIVNNNGSMGEPCGIAFRRMDYGQ